MLLAPGPLHGMAWLRVDVPPAWQRAELQVESVSADTHCVTAATL